MIGVRVALLETSNDGMNINYRVLYTTLREKSIDDFSHSSQFSKPFHLLPTPIFNLYFGKLYACRLMGLMEM